MVLGCQLVFGSHSSFSSDMPVPYVYQFGTEKDEEFCTLSLDVICFSFILCMSVDLLQLCLLCMPKIA